MPDDKFAALIKIAARRIPGYQLAEEVRGAFVQQQLDQVSVEWLLEQIPRLRILENRLAALEQRLKEEVTLTLYELLPTTLLKIRETAEREKRNHITNALINPVGQGWKSDEYRFFCRLARELDVAHVHLLRRLRDDRNHQIAEWRIEDGLFHELIARGLVYRERENLTDTMMRAVRSGRTPSHYDDGDDELERVARNLREETQLGITDLGEQLLKEIEDPPEIAG